MDVGLLIALGVDSLLVSTLYYYLGKKAKTLIDIQGLTEFDINSFKSKGSKPLPNVIEYGMVVGKIVPVEATKVLHSNFNKEYRGVVRVLELREHSTSIRDSIVRDTSRLMSSVVNYEPFKLVKKSWEVIVEQANEASYIEENLKQTYNNFQVNMDSLTSKVVTAIISKETVKGVETTESMLLTGTTVTCFGRLEQLPYSSSAPMWVPGTIKHQYKLTPPSSEFTYIITSMTKPELVTRLKSTTKALKISLWIFGSIGLGIVVYLGWTHGKGFIDRKRREYRLNQARLKRIADRRARAQNFENEGSGSVIETVVVASGANVDTNCVICLINPREVILLDCGHVCLCMDCLELMPNQSCPICRENYRTFAPAYIA